LPNARPRTFCGNSAVVFATTVLLIESSAGSFPQVRAVFLPDGLVAISLINGKRVVRL
jgi:hypothetical protein